MTDWFPASIDEVSADWLSDILNTEVRSFEAAFLPGGVLGDTHRLKLDLAPGPPTGPESVVIKQPTLIDDRRELAITNRFYLKELRFLQTATDGLPVNVPDVYAIAEDGSPDASSFVIVMEDLAAHSTVFDQLNDPPDVPFAGKFCEDIAALHGHFWESERLSENWIGRPDGRYEFGLDAMCRECPEHLDDLCREYEQIYQQDLFDTPEAPTALALTRILAGPHCNAICDYLNEALNQRPLTLLHGDLRADNIFRTTGAPVETARLTYIDWQLLHAGPPGPDFTQAWAHSLPPETRRHDLTLLKGYHDRLLEVQPQADKYTYDMLIEDYRYGYLLYWMAIVSAIAIQLPDLEESPDRDHMRLFYRQALYYMLVALHEHECLDAVERIVTEVT